MVLCKFDDDDDLGTGLWSFKCLHMDVQMDGSKCVERPVVPRHELLACSGAASCLSQSFCTSSSDGFTVDCEAGLRCWNEWHNFERICMDIRTVSCQDNVGVDIHLCLPWKQVCFGVIILVAKNVVTLDGDAVSAAMMSTMPLLRSKSKARH
jgi:hypothetical protein